jgi:hypothetical protein
MDKKQHAKSEWEPDAKTEIWACIQQHPQTGNGLHYVELQKNVNPRNRTGMT